ncbi:hypothetical protein J6590_071846 [Homalodisca vitripennis]|nr:hypothetical protein J6590_071846 [Homalodisca vitripennis]
MQLMYSVSEYDSRPYAIMQLVSNLGQWFEREGGCREICQCSSRVGRGAKRRRDNADTASAVLSHVYMAAHPFELS